MHKFPSKKIYDKTKQEFPDLYKNPGQYKIALFSGLNCPSVTDLGVEALKRIDCDFVIMWVYNLDRKEYVFSMRSREVDVSQICRSLGGGGHKLAAACSFPRSKYDIDEVFEGGILPRTLKVVDE